MEKRILCFLLLALIISTSSQFVLAYDPVSTTTENFTVSGCLSPGFSTGSSESYRMCVYIDNTEFYSITTEKGEFNFKLKPGMVSGNEYHITIAKKGYLKRTFKTNMVNKNIRIGSFESPEILLAGDLNCDNAINMADILCLAQHFNEAASEINSGDEEDFNDDGFINFADIMIIASNFSKSTSSYSLPSIKEFVPDISEVTPTTSDNKYEKCLASYENNSNGKPIVSVNVVSPIRVKSLTYEINGAPSMHGINGNTFEPVNLILGRNQVIIRANLEDGRTLVGGIQVYYDLPESTPVSTPVPTPTTHVCPTDPVHFGGIAITDITSTSVKANAGFSSCCNNSRYSGGITLYYRRLNSNDPFEACGLNPIPSKGSYSSYSAVIPYLEPNTTYYFRGEVFVWGGSFQGTFTTLPGGTPTPMIPEYTSTSQPLSDVPQ